MYKDLKYLVGGSSVAILTLVGTMFFSPLSSQFAHDNVSRGSSWEMDINELIEANQANSALSLVDSLIEVKSQDLPHFAYFDRFLSEDERMDVASAGLYIVVALIMPVFCLGYNPYSVLEASRAWHFDKYAYSQNGLLCVSNGTDGGLRDRYGVILPLEYDRIELLDSSKPYCKVRKNRMWQIYDIERHELVCDEWFEEVVQCDEYVYRLKSQNGDKYMTIQWYYNRYDEEQSAVISDELAVKKEE